MWPLLDGYQIALSCHQVRTDCGCLYVTFLWDFRKKNYGVEEQQELPLLDEHQEAINNTCHWANENYVPKTFQYIATSK